MAAGAEAAEVAVVGEAAARAASDEIISHLPESSEAFGKVTADLHNRVL